jgi:hypothetical protein
MPGFVADASEFSPAASPGLPTSHFKPRIAKTFFFT